MLTTAVRVANVAVLLSDFRVHNAVLTHVLSTTMTHTVSNVRLCVSHTNLIELHCAAVFYCFTSLQALQEPSVSLSEACSQNNVDLGGDPLAQVTLLFCAT
jgi:hypothetical protein